MKSESSSREFPGKIGVITSNASVNSDTFKSAEGLVLKYGADKITHALWPANFLDERDTMTSIVASLAADRYIKALIINQAYMGSSAAVKKIKKARDDIFIVYCTIHEPLNEAAECANLMLGVNDIDMGPLIVRQAKKQGAKVFVYYSFPRHLIIPSVNQCRELIRETCEKEGIRFIETFVLDPLEDSGVNTAKRYIFDSVPKYVARYGEDTAFFCTNCTLQAPLIKAVTECHAIFPQPCCPSPQHGFPEALCNEAGKDFADLNQLIAGIGNTAKEKNMKGRLSTWPVSASMMFTNAAAEYSIKRMKGEVPGTGIEIKALTDIMNNYVHEATGKAGNVNIKSHRENGVTYDNYKLVLMNYLNF